MEKFDEKDSLKLITEMINTAKHRLEDNSFFFLLWGWGVLISSLLHYVLMVQNVELHFLPWPIIMTGCGIVSAIKGRNMGKKSVSVGYFDKFISTLWIFTGITIVLALFLLANVSDFKSAYVCVLLLYGLGTLITGTVIRFVPLIVGGIFIWCCAIAFLWVDFPEALLLTGFSVLGGYIIPGYLLRARREKKPTYAMQ